MRFEGKTVLVTGAAGGIGQTLTTTFVAEGARVAVTDLDTAMLTTTADARFDGDLTDRAFCDALPRQVHDRFGRLDILVNNAGMIARGLLTEATDSDIATSLAVNVEAPLRLCRAAIPIMAAQGGGAIVNTASCWGLRPGPNHPIYVMTKAAVASLTQCLGRDHAHQNIRVNAVCPNEVNTPMLRTGLRVRGFDPDTAIAELGKTVPLGRIAEPEDIADVVLFLASDQSRYMTGTLVEVNGGKPVA